MHESYASGHGARECTRPRDVKKSTVAPPPLGYGARRPEMTRMTATTGVSSADAAAPPRARARLRRGLDARPGPRRPGPAGRPRPGLRRRRHRDAGRRRDRRRGRALRGVSRRAATVVPVAAGWARDRRPRSTSRSSCSLTEPGHRTRHRASTHRAHAAPERRSHAPASVAALAIAPGGARRRRPARVDDGADPGRALRPAAHIRRRARHDVRLVMRTFAAGAALDRRRAAPDGRRARRRLAAYGRGADSGRLLRRPSRRAPAALDTDVRHRRRHRLGRLRRQRARGGAWPSTPDGAIVLAGWVAAPSAGPPPHAGRGRPLQRRRRARHELQRRRPADASPYPAAFAGELPRSWSTALGGSLAAGFSRQLAALSCSAAAPTAPPDAGFGAGRRRPTAGGRTPLRSTGSRSTAAGALVAGRDRRRQRAGAAAARLRSTPSGRRSRPRRRASGLARFPSPFGGDAPRRSALALGPGGTVYTAGRLDAPAAAVRLAPRPERGAGRRADGARAGARGRAGDIRRGGLDRPRGRAAALRVRPRRRRLVRVRRRREPARAAQLPRPGRLQRRRPGDRPARRERDRDARHHRRRRPRAAPQPVLGKQGVASRCAASCASACPARRSSSC